MKEKGMQTEGLVIMQEVPIMLPASVFSINDDRDSPAACESP